MNTEPVTNGLNPTHRVGLVLIGVLALASAISTVTLTCFIAYRASQWPKFYAKDIKKNVFVVLLCNLFVADLLQAVGFMFSWHWLELQDIVSSTAACSAQGFLINLGDVASAFFVLVLALQTWAHLRFQKRLRFDAFLAIVICMWIFALLLTVLGPATASDYFVDTGAWCWVDHKYTSQRLAYHYFWIFLVEFSSIIVYGFVIWELRRSSQRLQTQTELSSEQAADTHRRIRKSCLIMCCYPVAYLALTLPLAVSRMYEVRGTKSSLTFRIFCGCFLVSSGWVDALLYVLTRASFLRSEGHQGNNDEHRPQDRSSHKPAPPPEIPATASRSSPAKSNHKNPVDAPRRMTSVCSWRSESDTKTLSYSCAEEPMHTFDSEILMMPSRTLTLDAKIKAIHESR